MEHSLNFHFLFGDAVVNDDFCPEAVQIGYGLQNIGHKITSNRDYWKTEHGYLFQKPNKPINCDYLVVDHRFNYSAKAWAVQDFIRSKFPECKKILLERQCGQECTPDWNRHNWIDFYDLILCTDRTIHHPRHPKIRPWQIGLIPEIASELSNNKVECPKLEIQFNFRIGHSLRSQVLKQLSALELSWTIQERFWLDDSPHPLRKPTGGRFNQRYFQGINSSKMLLAVGGYLSPYPFSYLYFDERGNPKVPLHTKIERRIRKLFDKMGVHIKTEIVIQWDSFRLWEAMYSTTAPILLDFDAYGLEIPIKPVKWVHYIPFDHRKPEKFLKGLNDLNNSKIEAIGVAGRKWFEDNYSPTIQAKRLLTIID